MVATLSISASTLQDMRLDPSMVWLDQAYSSLASSAGILRLLIVLDEPTVCSFGLRINMGCFDLA